MNLAELLKKENISVYQCSKESNVPYTTLLDLVKGRTRIEKCQAETVYKLAKALHMTMDKLMENCMDSENKQPYRCEFETFKSNVCQMVKDKGDMDFIIEVLGKDEIRKYWDRQWYRECFYLLAMVDYLCRENELPLCTGYDDIRDCSLSEPLFPRDISLAAK